MKSDKLRLLKTDEYIVLTDHSGDVYVYRSKNRDGMYNEFVGEFESLNKFIEASLPAFFPQKVAQSG